MPVYSTHIDKRSVCNLAWATFICVHTLVTREIALASTKLNHIIQHLYISNDIRWCVHVKLQQQLVVQAAFTLYYFPSDKSTCISHINDDYVVFFLELLKKHQEILKATA